MTPSQLGHPRVHLRQTGSTNELARELAAAGAPHGTLVTASEQLAGRGRQGRAWIAPAGSALLCSWVIREPPPLLSLAAGVAVAETVQRAIDGKISRPTDEKSSRRSSTPSRALVKWPNDVLLDGRKLAGILVEGRPREDWAVLGIGLNVAGPVAQLPQGLRDRAATLGLAPAGIEPLLAWLQQSLQRWLPAPDADVLAALSARDALRGQAVSWAQGSGTATGIDDRGRLVVRTPAGAELRLDAGEVHLTGSRPA